MIIWMYVITHMTDQQFCVIWLRAAGYWALQRREIEVWSGSIELPIGY